MKKARDTYQADVQTASVTASIPRKFILTWDDFEEALENLATTLVLQGVTRGTEIVGCPRGGLPLAVALSHRLGLPLVTSPTPGNPVIWVDDIMESGRTLREAYLRFGRQAAHFQPVVWVAKPGTQSALYHLDVARDVWVVFPWEVNTDLAIAKDRDAYEARRAPETKPKARHTVKA